MQQIAEQKFQFNKDEQYSFVYKEESDDIIYIESEEDLLMAYELVPEDLKILLIETESENEDEEVGLEK